MDNLLGRLEFEDFCDELNLLIMVNTEMPTNRRQVIKIVHKMIQMKSELAKNACLMFEFTKLKITLSISMSRT
jgi:hypothetical protein